MSIDYSLLRSFTARQMITALTKDGFTLKRQVGSHRHYRHPDGRHVTVTFHHSSSSFPLKTLKRMIEDQAGWNEYDLYRLNLVEK